MGSQTKTVLLILILLFIPSSSGRVKGFKGGEGPATSVSKVTIIMDMREVLMTDALLDYGKPGPNPRHDQGKGRSSNGGGGGGGNIP
ncbi:unnamed protein product, partial [Vitis vinifera]|uniref:Uncharacterized protein n=1 Tax=Vitis vinifera TaxID=29760 RepID=A5BNV6_VITVI